MGMDSTPVHCALSANQLLYIIRMPTSPSPISSFGGGTGPPTPRTSATASEFTAFATAMLDQSESIASHSSDSNGSHTDFWNITDIDGMLKRR
jgi:hypothetical protein